MPIVGGLDIHRKQITFDYLDTVTGEVKRGQIAPADREHVRAWLARFTGCGDAAFAVEGCAGWRYVAEELAAAGIGAHLGEPADTAALRGRKRHAKTDKTDARHLRALLAEGRLPECWIPPAQILEYRALLETYHDLRREHTAQAQLRGVLPPGRPAAERRGPCAPSRAGPACGPPRPRTCRRPGSSRSPPPWTCSPPPKPSWARCATSCAMPPGT
jgi:Transposase